MHHIKFKGAESFLVLPSLIDIIYHLDLFPEFKYRMLNRLQIQMKYKTIINFIVLEMHLLKIQKSTQFRWQHKPPLGEQTVHFYRFQQKSSIFLSKVLYFYEKLCLVNS